MNQNTNTGMGDYHIRKMYTAQQAIFKILSDGKWHQYTELKETTKLSSHTLVKHLNTLNKDLNLLERREDKESGKYPIPVYYKATPELLCCFILPNSEREMLIKNNRKWLEETNDPLEPMGLIHFSSLNLFISIIDFLQTRQEVNWEQIELLEETWLYQNYKILTHDLIAECYKIREKIDLNKLLLQAKRQVTIWENIVKQLSDDKQNFTLNEIVENPRKSDL
jgi:hypothetical protein